MPTQEVGNSSFEDGYYWNIDRQFDLEYWEYEDNRHLYHNIKDCHITESWIVNISIHGKQVRRRVKRLSDAVKVRDSLRALRNVK